VPGERCVGRGRFVRRRRQSQLQHSERLATIGHWRIEPGSSPAGLDVHPLSAQHATLGRPFDRHPLAAVIGADGRARADEPGKSRASVVRHEKTDVVGCHHSSQLLGQRLHSLHRSSPLHREQQCAQLKPSRGTDRHRRSVRH